MAVLQPLHFPLKVRKLTQGISSSGPSVRPHTVQWLLPRTTLSSRGSLSATTFKKLKIQAPIINRISHINPSVSTIILLFSCFILYFLCGDHLISPVYLIGSGICLIPNGIISFPVYKLFHFISVVSDLKHPELSRGIT